MLSMSDGSIPFKGLILFVIALLILLEFKEVEVKGTPSTINKGLFPRQLNLGHVFGLQNPHPALLFFG
jgi:hypothetical protein